MKREPLDGKSDGGCGKRNLRTEMSDQSDTAMSFEYREVEN